MEMSISLKLEAKQTSIRHNNRTLSEEEYQEPAHSHIIRERTKDNIVIRQEPIAEAYKRLFDEQVAEYNSRQKRNDRKIDNYYKHVQKSKTLNLQKEMIIAVGSKDDWDALSYDDKKKAGRAIEEYVRAFIEANKSHIYVYNAMVHLDEAGAPHAHVNFIPLAHGYRNGLGTQPSWSKALDQLGYKGKGKKPFISFRETEVKRIEEALKEIGITRKVIGERNYIPSIKKYKEIMELKDRTKEELQKLQQDFSTKDNELEELKGEVEAKEIDLALLDGELAEKQELAQGARQEAQEAQDKADRLKAQIVETNQALSEKSELLNRQQAQLERNDRAIDEQIKQYEQNNYIEQRTRVLNDLEKASRVSYNDNHVRPNKLNPDEVIIKKEHYKNLKQRAGFSDIIGNFASTIVSKIQQTSIYKALEAEMNKWKNAYNNLKAKYNKLEKENENLRQELGKLRHQNDVGRDLGILCEKYLPQDERDSLYRRLSRLKKEEDKRLERDDFSYDYDR